MKELTILADDVRVQPDKNQVEVTLYNYELDFNTIDDSEIIETHNNLQELFSNILEYDEYILPEYLRNAGFILTKDNK